MFVPMALGIMVTNLSSPRLAARVGPRGPLVIGMVVCAGGLLGLLWAGPVWQTALLLVPFGIVGLSVPTLTTVLLENVPAEQAGIAGGVFNAGRQVGSALAVALFGSLVGGGSFRHGMTVSLLISAVLLAVAAAANAAVHRSR